MKRIRSISFIMCSFLLCSYQAKAQDFFGDWYQDEVVILQNLSDSMFVEENSPAELKKMVVQSMINQENGKAKITLTKDSLHTYRSGAGETHTAIKWVGPDKYQILNRSADMYNTLEILPDGRLRRVSNTSENVYYFRRNVEPSTRIITE